MFNLFKKKKEKPFVSAIVAAGGTGTRMGENKLLIDILGVPVLAHTLMALEKSPAIDEIIICAHESSIVEYGQLGVDYGITKLSCVVRGGETRSESVFNGISSASKDSRFLLIHDGARPCVTEDDIRLVCSKAFVCGGATASTPVKDTIKLTNEGRIDRTVPRERLVQVQTPQVFDRDLLFAALKKAIDEKMPITDDCQALELMDFKPTIVNTSPLNIKITTKEDLVLAEAILNSERKLTHEDWQWL